MFEIKRIIGRLEAGERSDELDKLISRAFGYSGSDVCPPYSHRSPLMRMATLARLRVLHIVVVEIAFAGRDLAALAVLAVGALGRALERGRAGGRRRRRRRLRQHGGSREPAARRAPPRSAGRRLSRGPGCNDNARNCQ